MARRSRLVQHLEKLSRGVLFCTATFGTLCAALLLGHYLLAAAAHMKRTTFAAPGEFDSRQHSPVYDDFPDKTTLWKNLSECTETHFEPYIHWRRNPFSSQYVNVDAQGVRRTVKAPTPGAAKVFMFGGSTVWGAGSPDSHTVSSHLQGLLGDRYDVHNYGEDAYVAAQELNYLLRQLALGNVPRVVVFYDGINDGSAGAYSPGVPRDPEQLRFLWKDWKRSKREGLLKHAFRRSSYPMLGPHLRDRLGVGPKNRWAAWDRQIEPKIDENAAQVVRFYDAHIRQVKALAREYGFRAFFFWQPNLLTDTRKTCPCEDEIVCSQSPVLVKSQRLVYKYAKEAFSGREDEDVFFLGNVLDKVPEPTYIDWCHPGPRGNGIIAAHMHKLIAPRH